MIVHLKRIFGVDPPVAGMLEDREPFELATAALLIELARSDFSESAEEIEAIRHLLQKRFSLSESALDTLIGDADPPRGSRGFPSRVHAPAQSGIAGSGQTGDRRDALARQSCGRTHR